MESTDASGRPLATIIPHSSQGTTTQSSSLRKRRRDSQSSDERVKSSRRRPTSSKDVFVGPHSGFSRGQSSPMQRSTSPTSSMQADVKYTSTGRISKAKKGLKVHNCECGRSYTRAEHLRRHQKNHNQDALVCNFPRCGKTFYRPDLLQRHQERHNEPSKDQSRRTSLYSQGSAAEVEGPLITSAPSMSSSLPMDAVSRTHDNPSTYLPVSVSPMQEQTSDPRYKAAQFLTPQTPTSKSGTFLRPSTNATKQQRAYGASTRQQSVAVPTGAHDSMTTYSGIDFNPWNGSPNYSSSSGYASPGPGHDYSMFVGQPFGSSSNRTRTSSNASFIEPQWSSYPSTRSPTSATSTMPFSWSGTEKSPHLGLALQMVTTSGGYPVPGMSAPADMPGFLMYPTQKTAAQRDEEEQQFLFPEHLLGMADTYQFQIEQYLDNYWRLFHPSFPVIHKPTFVNESPLLRAAMIAIGAQYTDDSGAKAKSRLLHDKCVKLLNQRDIEVTQSSRLCDLQCVFLVEVLSQYRARRGAKILTRRFEEMYRKLSQDPKVQTSTTLEALASQPPISNEQPTYDRWCQWIELSSRQHLLLCSYILETQQTILLARPQQHSLLPHLSGDALPFPSSVQLWEAPSAVDWAISLHQQPQTPGYVYEVTSDIGVSTRFSPLDVFQSSLLLATHYNHFHNSTPYLQPPSYPSIDHLLDPSPLTRHHLFTAQLLQHVPVRALLAVSGESWILSEKVASIASFAGYKATLRTWLNDLWTPEGPNVKPVRAALKVAINMLCHAMTAPAQTLCLEPGAEMGLYYAVLVLWAVALASTSRQTQAQNPRHPQHRSPSQSRRPSQGAVPPFSPPGYGASTNLAQNPSQLQQSNNPAHPSTTSFLPTVLASQARPSNTNSMLQSDITFTSLTFLNLASHELDTLGISPWPRDLAQWQQGVGALLRWAKMRLRSGAIDGRDSVVSTGPTSGSMSRGTDGLGELLDGVVSVLEKIMSRGWEGWGI
ncbi:uncharacterized protein BDZ99DRAFT_524790 [Mytilinidion resinicola]|uniref:C2H2-type domain-containing protein n=1 Tax=Mytilinidion resinicola TaxID=574789 RepID=A0A6A6YB58_9PEZI|nr:uncharacterized protein BDZ99DRAFT_524790 [Mytilinidion resinicola]KAF2805067.1 hypothetical protein BDZ99DRAFT_524790 [Mytilinidion resinicola]